MGSVITEGGGGGPIGGDWVEEGRGLGGGVVDGTVDPEAMVGFVDTVDGADTVAAAAAVGCAVTVRGGGAVAPEATPGFVNTVGGGGTIG